MAHMWPSSGKSAISAHQLKSTFYSTSTWKLHPCTIKKHQVLDHRWPSLHLQTAFCCCCWTTRMHFLAMRGINRTAWDTKLLLAAVSSSPVDCISLCQLLKAKHCSLSPICYFTPPSAPHRPNHPPHPPPIDSIRDITGAEKTIWKTSSIQVANRISYEMIAIYVRNYTIHTRYLTWLYCATGEIQCIKYFKLVFLEIQNVRRWPVFPKMVI